MRTFFAFFILCIFVFAGCTGNPTSPAASSSSSGPAVGSYYLMQTVVTDSTGKVISIDTTKELVIATGVTIYGASNVVELIDSSSAGWAKDTNYLRYLANGDLSRYVASSTALSGDPYGWFTYPFTTQDSISWFALDTSSHNVSYRDTAWVVGAPSGTFFDTTHGTTYTGTQNITAHESLHHTAGKILVYSGSWAETFIYYPSPVWHTLETDLPGFAVLGTMQPSQVTRLIAYGKE